MSRPRWRVRLTGRGGQGIMLAGTLLAEAGMLDGLFVVQTQTYGPEARLGASKSEVILAQQEIDYPEVIEPDVLLCLSPEAYAKYGLGLAEGGLRLVDAEVTRKTPVEDAVVLPIVETARELGNPLAANVIALGALLTHTGLVSEAGIRSALRSRVKPEFVEINLRALAIGEALSPQKSPAAR